MNERTVRIQNNIFIIKEKESIRYLGYDESVKIISFKYRLMSIIHVTKYTRGANLKCHY